MAMGADPSSGQGGMMQAILQNQARNNATNQMANMIPQFMNQGYNLQQQGLKGMGDWIVPLHFVKQMSSDLNI